MRIIWNICYIIKSVSIYCSKYWCRQCWLKFWVLKNFLMQRRTSWYLGTLSSNILQMPIGMVDWKQDLWLTFLVGSAWCASTANVSLRRIRDGDAFITCVLNWCDLYGHWYWNRLRVHRLASNLVNSLRIYSFVQQSESYLNTSCWLLWTYKLQCASSF